MAEAGGDGSLGGGGRDCSISLRSDSVLTLEYPIAAGPFGASYGGTGSTTGAAGAMGVPGARETRCHMFTNLQRKRSHCRSHL